MLGGALAILMLLSGITDEDRAQLAPECNERIWELHYRGEVIPLGDMTEAECEAARDELEYQTKAFEGPICKWRWACRQEL